MAAAWLNIDSSHLDSFDAQHASYPVAGALDGTGMWAVLAAIPHWFIIDLGASYVITQVRGRSNYTGWDPEQVKIYISDDKENFGAEVASNISSWKDITTWVIEAVTEKTGRYVKVEVNWTAHPSSFMAFGWDASPFKIFDVFGEPPPAAYSVDKLRKDVRTGYHCFMAAYLGAKVAGEVPLKLPDGTIF